MIRFFKIILLLLFFLIGISIIILIFINYLPPTFTNGFLKGKELLFNKGYAIPFYMHIFGGVMALLSGIILFTYDFQFKAPRFHRFLGRIYVVSVLVFGAVGGFLMSFFAKGGLISIIGFATLGILWFYFTYKALYYAKNKDFANHNIMITRSFMLTLAAPILRIELFVNNHWQLMDATVFYTITSWISWLPQLLTFEWINLKKRK